MVRFTFFLILFLLSVNNSYCKNEYNNWLMGKYAGISFNSNTKPFEINDNVLDSTYEGCFTYSDENGRVLLACNGTKLVYYNPKAKIFDLKNSIQIFRSSSQSNLILKSLSNPNQYYIILSGEIENLKTTSRPIFYLFDITMNSGNGGFVEEAKVFSMNEVNEHIAAYYYKDINVYSIAFLQKNENALNFLNISPNGIENSVFTAFTRCNIKFDSSNYNYKQGRLKYSPDGKKLAYINYNNQLEIFALPFYTFAKTIYFDTSVANRTNFDIEFSPNSKYLFVTYTIGNKSFIDRMDLSSENQDSIQKSIINVFQTDKYYFTAMQLAINNKIYATKFFPQNKDMDFSRNTDLAVINQTNQEDCISTFEESGFKLGTNSNAKFMLGLPNRVWGGEQEKRLFVNSPNVICFGDSIPVEISINYADSFSGEISNIKNPQKIIKTFNSTNSSIIVNILAEELWNNSYKVKINVNNEVDSTIFVQSCYQCCRSNIANWNFRSVSANGNCFPVDYDTELDFRSDPKKSCTYEFTALGQIGSSGNARYANPNFEATSPDPKDNSHTLYGDPNPNRYQKAWKQVNPTKIGVPYRFTAFVRNAEKITRGNDIGKELSFVIGKSNNQKDDTLDQIQNVKFEQGWIKLSGTFIAKNNNSEFFVAVYGKSPNNTSSSYAFAIDDLDLSPLDNFLVDLGPDTSICINDSVKLNSNPVYLSKDIISATWEPITGLDNPNSISPIAKPKEKTTYKIIAKNKYDCTTIDSITIDSKKCFSYCKPKIDIQISDTTVESFKDFCLNVNYTPTCKNQDLYDTLFLKFKYNSNFMKLISCKYRSEIFKINGLDFIQVAIPYNQIQLSKSNQFDFCFSSTKDNIELDSIVAIEDSSQYELIKNNHGIINIFNIESCIANASISVPDSTVELGAMVCIPIQIIIACTDTSHFLNTFATISLEYNPRIFDYRSIDARFLNLNKIDEKNQELIFGVEFRNKKYRDTMNLNLCGLTLLADTLATKLDISNFSGKNAILTNKKNGSLNFNTCVQNLRLIRFGLLTDVSIKQNNQSIDMFLQSEEIGDFECEIINSIGSTIKSFSYSNKEKTNKSLIQTFIKNNFANGLYFLKVKTPLNDSKTYKFLINN